jgi:hypothetical protein
VSFVDNVPHGTVMTLRIPQQQAVDSATVAVAAPAAAAPAEFTPSSISTTANSAGSNYDEHSNAPLTRMHQTVLEATAAADEMLLRTKHILVSEDPVLKFRKLVTCVFHCRALYSGVVYTLESVLAHAQDALHAMHWQPARVCVLLANGCSWLYRCHCEVSAFSATYAHCVLMCSCVHVICMYTG